MVEVDVQFLVGVAVTVYLALLFFGVIVLWDISLALRGVGEKIDKLEDNIDDDLADIGYALDGMSDGPGGGGTQLHLSGGTISSGPQGPEGGMQHVPSQPQHPQEAYGSQAQTGAHHSHPDRGKSPAAPPQDEPEPEMGDKSVEMADEEQDELVDEGREGLDDEERDELDDEERVDEGDRADDEERDEKLEDDEGEGGDEETGVSDRDDGDTASEDASLHAARNRGRFVTSPDRTPWYAVELNRDAIAAAKEPTIAGELEAPGTDSRAHEPEVIVAGPATDADAEEKSVADRSVESDARETEFGDETVAGDERDEAPDEGYSPVDDREALSYDESNLERTVEHADGQTDEEPNGDIEEFGGDVEEPERQPDQENENEEGLSSEEDDKSEDESEEEDVDTGDGVESNDTTIESDEESGDESGEGDIFEDETGEDDEEFEDESKEDDEEFEDEIGEDDSPAAGDERAEAELDDVETEPFEFVEEDSDEMLSADDAAEQLNEEAPALSLSSHGFELTATVDDESAVLVFEFDPGTVDISGSTKRLLTYQLSSYADQESSPDGDVTIERNSIVVEIPNADGMAIEDWANAAVDIIDRTLYLSDSR